MSCGAGVLDVAGGQASLSWELLNIHGIPTTVIDPRPVLRCRRFERRFNHWHRVGGREQEALVPLRPRHWPVYWRDDVWRPLLDGGGMSALSEALRSRPVQHNSARRTRKGYFDAATSGQEEEEESEAPLPSAEEALAVLRDCSMAIGLHPDSATESIVDFALACGKSFAVVPCCVCSVDFPNRQLGGSKGATEYEAFIEYLVAKAPGHIGVVTLPGFEGRNRCVYSLPPTTKSADAANDADCCAPCAEEPA